MRNNMHEAPEDIAVYYILHFLALKGSMSQQQLARLSRIRTYVGCIHDVAYTLSYMASLGMVTVKGGVWTLTAFGAKSYYRGSPIVEKFYSRPKAADKLVAVRVKKVNAMLDGAK